MYNINVTQTSNTLIIPLNSFQFEKKIKHKPCNTAIPKPAWEDAKDFRERSVLHYTHIPEYCFWITLSSIYSRTGNENYNSYSFLWGWRKLTQFWVLMQHLAKEVSKTQFLKWTSQQGSFVTKFHSQFLLNQDLSNSCSLRAHSWHTYLAL